MILPSLRLRLSIILPFLFAFISLLCPSLLLSSAFPTQPNDHINNDEIAINIAELDPNNLPPLPVPPSNLPIEAQPDLTNVDSRSPREPVFTKVSKEEDERNNFFSWIKPPPKSYYEPSKPSRIPSPEEGVSLILGQDFLDRASAIFIGMLPSFENRTIDLDVRKLGREFTHLQFDRISMPHTINSLPQTVFTFGNEKLRMQVQNLTVEFSVYYKPCFWAKTLDWSGWILSWFQLHRLAVPDWLRNIEFQDGRIHVKLKQVWFEAMLKFINPEPSSQDLQHRTPRVDIHSFALTSVDGAPPSNSPLFAFMEGIYRPVLDILLEFAVGELNKELGSSYIFLEQIFNEFLHHSLDPLLNGNKTYVYPQTDKPAKYFVRKKSLVLATKSTQPIIFRFAPFSMFVQKDFITVLTDMFHLNNNDNVPVVPFNTTELNQYMVDFISGLRHSKPPSMTQRSTKSNKPFSKPESQSTSTQTPTRRHKKRPWKKFFGRIWKWVKGLFGINKSRNGDREDSVVSDTESFSTALSEEWLDSYSEFYSSGNGYSRSSELTGDSEAYFSDFASSAEGRVGEDLESDLEAAEMNSDRFDMNQFFLKTFQLNEENNEIMNDNAGAASTMAADELESDREMYPEIPPQILQKAVESDEFFNNAFIEFLMENDQEFLQYLDANLLKSRINYDGLFTVLSHTPGDNDTEFNIGDRIKTKSKSRGKASSTTSSRSRASLRGRIDNSPSSNNTEIRMILGQKFLDKASTAFLQYFLPLFDSKRIKIDDPYNIISSVRVHMIRMQPLPSPDHPFPIFTTTNETINVAIRSGYIALSLELTPSKWFLMTTLMPRLQNLKSLPFVRFEYVHDPDNIRQNDRLFIHILLRNVSLDAKFGLDPTQWPIGFKLNQFRINHLENVHGPFGNNVPPFVQDMVSLLSRFVIHLGLKAGNWELQKSFLELESMLNAFMFHEFPGLKSLWEKVELMIPRVSLSTNKIVVSSRGARTMQTGDGASGSQNRVEFEDSEDYVSLPTILRRRSRVYGQDGKPSNTRETSDVARLVAKTVVTFVWRKLQDGVKSIFNKRPIDQDDDFYSVGPEFSEFGEIEPLPVKRKK